jgi:hypothetical protein
MNRQRIDLILARLAASLFSIALILNYFRYELFGVVPGYAPHNFSFNFSIFIPLTVSALLLSTHVNFRVLLYWSDRPNLLQKLLALLLTTPIIVLFFYMIFATLRVPG